MRQPGWENGYMYMDDWVHLLSPEATTVLTGHTLKQNKKFKEVKYIKWKKQVAYKYMMCIYEIINYKYNLYVFKTARSDTIYDCRPINN